MATPGRRPVAALEQILLEEPYRFDFFQAVRLLGRLHPDRAPVGRAEHPGREVARFRAQPGLAFPPSSIQQVTPPSGPDEPIGMTVAFLGLTGPSGVLPHTYSELVEDRARAGDRTLGAFLDLFGHRLVSLFYRAWEKHNVVVPHERGEADGFDRHLFSLMGLGIRPLRGRHDFNDEALLYFAGLFGQRHRPAVMLSALLRGFFGLDFEIRQFQGAWLDLGDDDRSTLGASGAHNGLGTSLVIGRRVWDEQGRFRIRIGPLGFKEFRDYLPGGPALRPLAELVRLYVDAELDFDIQLVLRAEEVPACRLSSEPGGGARLGRHAWLKSRPFDRDAEDAVFEAGA